jgi:hypothetical protein
MDGNDGTRKETEDTTILVQIEEVMRAIRRLSFVTEFSPSPVGVRNSHGHGYRVSLRCSVCEEYGICGKKQESPVQVSNRHPTLIACLQDLLKRLQDRHGEFSQTVDTSEKATVDTPNVMETMTLFQKV